MMKCYNRDNVIWGIGVEYDSGKLVLLITKCHLPQFTHGTHLPRINNGNT